MFREEKCGKWQPLVALCCSLIVIQACAQITKAQYSSDSYYDPENGHDGALPVLRHSNNVAPGVGWSGSRGGGSIDDDQHDIDDIQRVVHPPAPSPMALRAAEMKRRNSYVEPDDGLDEDDEEDRDEYQSGSRNHDSYTENPAFGESRKAAKDGEDIENFFDNHLGPQEAIESASSVPESRTSEDSSNDAAGDRMAQSSSDDPDEMYEAAASGPLATIINTLLNLHKRPLVITTEDSPLSSNSNKDTSQDSSSPLSSSSSSSLVSNLLGSSSGLQGSAFSPTDGNLTPIAYLGPLNSASSIISHEPFIAQTVAPPNGHDSSESSDSDGQVQEIYIARRPSLFSSHHNRHHFQAYTPVLNQEKSSSLISSRAPQITAASWTNNFKGYTTQAEPYSDFSKYPVAASQNYQREPYETTADNNDDEEQTVSFGLSFGGHSPATDSSFSADKPSDSSDADDQSSADEQPAYVPYNTRNLMMRYPTSATKSSSLQTDYNYPAIATSPSYSRLPKLTTTPNAAAYMRQLTEQQRPFHGARYHKDPTESSTHQAVGYGNHYSRDSWQGSNSAPHLQTNNEQRVTRQQLLANLDRQIKTNRYYQQQPAQQVGPKPYSQGFQRAAAMRVDRVRPMQQTGASDYLDTYSSFHSEADPYRVLTTASRIVSEPVVDSILQSGITRVHSNADMDESRRITGKNLTTALSSLKPATSEKSITWLTELRRSSISSNIGRNSQLIPALKPSSKPIVGKSTQMTADHNHEQAPNVGDGVNGNLLRETNNFRNFGAKNNATKHGNKTVNLRVRRDDSDVGEDTEADDDGVWVDDDEDDDNRQQSSDVNETAQDPEEDEDNQQDAATSRVVRPVPYPTSDVVSGPHSYELAPGDMML